MATLGAGIYNQFFAKVSRPFAYSSSPTFPGVTSGSNRILSFQGRLTDSVGNPIIDKIDMVFRLYNTSSGPVEDALYTGSCTGVNGVTPDQDGIFNVLIGSDCGMSGIPSNIFTENPNVYLGITVGGDSEMPTRQLIANVGYALNAETLQGLPPGTNSSTIPYINSQGDLLIAAANPSLRSINQSANFVLSSAKTVTLTSATTGDIVLQATESGNINLRTAGTNDDYSRLFINNIGKVGIGITNPSQKLEVAGNIYANTGQIRLGNFSSAPTSIGAGSLYYDTVTNKAYYYNDSNWIEIGAGSTSDLWTQNLGLLYPINTTLDLAIGGTASSTAKFSFTNINSGTPTLRFNQTSAFDLPNTTVNALSIEENLISFDTQNSRIGISTTSPSYKFDVVGDIYSSANIRANTDLYIAGTALSTNTTSTSGASKIGLYDDSMNYISGDTNIQSAIKQLDTAIGSISGSASGWVDDGSIVRLTTSSDRVGIGTTSVNENTKLGILGGVTIGSQTYSDAQAPSNGLIIEGNVGIGKTSPTAKLDVLGNLNVSTYATVSASLAVGTGNAPAGPGNIGFSGYIQFERGTYDLTLTSAAPTGASRTLTIPALGADGNLTAYSGTLAAGDLLYGATTNVMTRLAVGSNNYVLVSNGTTPSWNTIGSAILPMTLWTLLILKILWTLMLI
jgi:hypothetical protein